MNNAFMNPPTFHRYLPTMFHPCPDLRNARGVNNVDLIEFEK
jgi:hypothetical protein